MDFNFTEVIGLVAAAFTTVSAIPQFVKTLKTQQTRDISLLAVIILIIGLLLWFVYGLLLGAIALIVSNIIGVVAWIFILVFKIKNG